MKTIKLPPKKTPFEMMDDDSTVVIGSRFRGISGRRRTSRRPPESESQAVRRGKRSAS